jgi:hypothetical protein
MRLALERRSSRLIWPLIGAVAAALSLAWVWHAKFADAPQLSPAAIVSSRFPAEWMEQTPKSVAAFVLAHALPREAPSPADPLDWLSRALLFDQAHQDLTGSLGFETPGPRSPGSAFQAMHGPRPVSQTPTLLNDAQIASIKERLRLTSEQEELWPSVEAALRAIAWRGTRETLNSKTATLDPRTVQNLKTALIPFLKQLRAEQKDELRMIAHLMGLERLGSQL